MISRHRVIALLFLVCMGAYGWAQQTSPAPAVPADPAQEKAQEKKIEKKEQSRRMLGLPQFGVTDRENAPPLTPKGKFRLFYRTAFDPAQLVVVGLQAGVSQAQNSFPAYGQGASGYSKRYAAAFADQTNSTFFADFLYPVLFKQDPRYFRLGEGSFKHRFGHALAQVVVSHKDRGGRTFNWSSVMAALTAGGISNAYYPQADRGFGLTMNRAGISLLYGSLGGLGSEFWPDIDRKLFHRHPRAKDLPVSQQPQK
jgi:hypothetical protein